MSLALLSVFRSINDRRRQQQLASSITSTLLQSPSPKPKDAKQALHKEMSLMRYQVFT